MATLVLTRPVASGSISSATGVVTVAVTGVRLTITWGVKASWAAVGARARSTGVTGAGRANCAAPGKRASSASRSG